MNMVITNYNTKEDNINKLQQLKGKTKLKFYKIIHNYFTEMKNRSFQSQEDTFAKNAQGVSKIYHEVSLVMKFLQTKPQVKNMNINYYDLYYTVIKSRDIQYENDENDYINFIDFIISNHYVEIKSREIILR